MSPDQTPVVTCSDGSGALPSCAPLAVPIVAPQGRGQQRYTHGEALNQGTLFPGLNLPFFRMEKAAGLADSPLTQLQALEFVVLELGTYLDTHPDDMEAFELFKQYSAMEQSAKAAYEAKFGPITKTSAAAGSSYRWLQDPWPWNFGQNEVK